MFILEKEREWTGRGAEEEWPASSALSVEPNLGSIPQPWEHELSQNQGLDAQLTEASRASHSNLFYGISGCLSWEQTWRSSTLTSFLMQGSSVYYLWQVYKRSSLSSRLGTKIQKCIPWSRKACVLILYSECFFKVAFFNHPYKLYVFWFHKTSAFRIYYFLT